MKTRNKYTLTTAAATIALAVGTGPVFADTELEWDPTWGIHEEEWYDPSDWFSDDGQVDIEDTGPLGYDDDYYVDDYWNDTSYYSNYGYDSDAFDTDLAPVYYQWEPLSYDWDATESSASEQKRSEAAKTTSNPNYDGESQEISKDNVVTMKGEVIGMTSLKPAGTEKAHRYLFLEPQEGKNVIVDLGSKADPSQMEIEKGDNVQVRGTRAKADGRFVLIAQQVGEVNESDSTHQ